MKILKINKLSLLFVIKCVTLHSESKTISKGKEKNALWQDR